MKNTLLKVSTILAAAVISASCIQESVPVGGSVTQEQVSASDFALMSMINAMPASLTTSGTGGYAGSYGDHTDFGIPGIHLRLEHMLEDIATMADNPYYNRFYAYDLNQAQGYQYTYCAYFWDMYYTWIRLANDVIASMVPAIEDGADEDTMVKLKNNLGQAYAYRAMCYLDLARLFEPKDNKLAPISDEIRGLTVPIVKEDITEELAKYNPRATREEMYEFIFSDLALAEKYLDAADKTYSRPTVGAVYGMYARAYQELGGTYHELGQKAKSDANYAKAAEYARKAIETSGEAQWHDPKSGFNDGSSNNAWLWGLTLSVENASNIITNVAHLAPEAIWGYSVMSLPSINKALYDRISVSDFRRRSWLDPDLTWSPGTENYTPSNGYQFAGTDDPLSGYEEVGFTTAHDYFLYWTAPYVNIKFRPANGQCVEYTEGNCADHVLMRVEEMYFIEIEAVLRTKGLAEAQKLLNSFMKTYRDRSYDCSYATSDLSFIQEMLLQKRIEFWGEGILFYDYKRLDQGITRGYSGTNFPAVARFNTEGRSPQWNLVITRGEYQSNTAINDGNNNPDSTELLVPWTE